MEGVKDAGQQALPRCHAYHPQLKQLGNLKQLAIKPLYFCRSSLEQRQACHQQHMSKQWEQSDESIYDVSSTAKRKATPFFYPEACREHERHE